MELQDKYSEALEITGKTLEEFLAWVHSFEESHITAKDSAASIAASIQSTIHWGASWPQSRRIKTIYTDGDGGILIFRAYCDMFEGEGMEVSVIGEGYCEIPYYIMQNMLFDIEKAARFADALDNDNGE